MATEVPVSVTRRLEPGSLSRPSMPSPRPSTAPAAFHVMAKPTGAICNLDCAYCFYLAKESLYPDGRFRMGEEAMEIYIHQLLEAQRSAPVVTIAWQGGEPTLMGLGFFRRVMQTVERCRRPGQRIEHTIQTNATLLDDDWGAFLASHDVLVGISIDGPSSLHDTYRLDKRGRPTFERVARGLQVLRRHGVRFNVLCSVSASNSSKPLDVYRFFRDDCGARFLQFIPIVEHFPTPGNLEATSDRSVTAKAWGEFLIAVFDEWLLHDVGEVSVQGFESAFGSWLGVGPGLCVFAETCGDALAIEHNGDVYSCDHFVTPEHRLGNIFSTHLIDLVASDKQRRFGSAKRDSLPQYCWDCDVRFACWGECPKNRFIKTPAGEAGLNYLCEGYKDFFHHIDGPMRLMSSLVREGRSAPEVMRILAKAPRNSPCPCGSTKKAKHCHRALSR